MYVNQPIIDPQIHYIVEFEGRLDEQRLRRAVRLAMDAEPVFGCRYVPGRRPRWERRDDLDSLALCEVVESADAESGLADYMALPCDAAVDPLVRIGIIRGANDTMCVKFSHVACDGPGGKQLMELIASLYRKLEGDPNYQVTPNLGSRSRMQLFREYGWGKSLRAFKNRGGRPRQSLWRFPTRDPEDRGGARLAMRRLDAERFRALRGYAAQSNATATDIFLAAYFRALCRLSNVPPGIPQTIFLPMNVRDYLATGKTEAICNFTAPLQLTLERISDEPFSMTLRRVAEQTLDSAQRRERAIAGALGISIAYRVALPQIQKGIEIAWRKGLESGLTMAFLTNNGTLEPKHMDFGLPVRDAYQNPPAAFAPNLFLAVISFRRSLSYSIRYCSRAINGEDVEAFLDAFLDEFPAVPDAGTLEPAEPRMISPGAP